MGSESIVQDAVNQAYDFRPRRLQDKGDSVKWWSFNAKGTRIDGDEDCYMGIMPHLPEQAIHLRPFGDYNSCAMVSLTSFLTLGMLEGLIVPDARIVNDNGLVGLFIPRGHDRHEVYISLSMYRHADGHARSIVLPTLELYRQLRKHGVSFWQCLYFAMEHSSIAGEYSSFREHSFVNINNSIYGERLTRDSWARMTPGLSVALWLKLDPTFRNRRALTIYCTTKLMQRFEARFQEVSMKTLTEILEPENNIRFQNPMELLEKPLKLKDVI